ncbi:unnamed protein product [Choristocarpus tenellus]
MVLSPIMLRDCSLLSMVALILPRVLSFAPTMRWMPSYDISSHRYIRKPTAMSMSGLTSSAAGKTTRPLELWLDARGKMMIHFGSLMESADRVVLDEATVQNNESEKLPRRWVVVQEDGRMLDESGDVVGASMVISDPKGQGRALSLVGSVDWIQVACSDWTMIPAENLVSAAGGTPTKIALQVIKKTVTCF